MAAIKALLGENIKNHEGKNVPVDSFTGDGKFVGLYFSAHWCPPCRMFTPKLAEFYKKLQAVGKQNLEIVFVSCDRDAKQFKDYFGEMPWLAFDYDNEDGRTAIMDKFGVQGIPAFIVLNGATGEIHVAEGRGKVDEDPEGAKFPWV